MMNYPQQRDESMRAFKYTSLLVLMLSSCVANAESVGDEIAETSATESSSGSSSGTDGGEGSSTSGTVTASPEVCASQGSRTDCESVEGEEGSTGCFWVETSRVSDLDNCEFVEMTEACVFGDALEQQGCGSISCSPDDEVQIRTFVNLENGRITVSPEELRCGNLDDEDWAECVDASTHPSCACSCALGS